VILDNLGEKSSGDIWQALQQDGIHTFADLGTLTFSDVDELKNTVSTETEQGTQTSDGSKPRKPIIYGSLFLYGICRILFGKCHINFCYH